MFTECISCEEGDTFDQKTGLGRLEGCRESTGLLGHRAASSDTAVTGISGRCQSWVGVVSSRVRVRLEKQVWESLGTVIQTQIWGWGKREQPPGGEDSPAGLWVASYCLSAEEAPHSSSCHCAKALVLLLLFALSACSS